MLSNKRNKKYDTVRTVPISNRNMQKQRQNRYHQETFICSTCRKHFPVLSSFMTYHWGYNQINTTGITSGAGTAYPSGALEFTAVFDGVRVTRSLVVCICFVDRCLSLCPLSFWPLCCLFFFELRILITSLISSNSSCIAPGLPQRSINYLIINLKCSHNFKVQLLLSKVKNHQRYLHIFVHLRKFSTTGVFM